MENKSAKYAFWGVILAALISGGIGLYIYSDGKSESKKTQELEVNANKSKDTANLTISNVYLSPINTKIDSVFFAEISNKSLNPAKDLSIKINFGEASVSQCEVSPINYLSKNHKFKNSIVSFRVNQLKRKDSFYIYCFISHPVFKSILITGSNLFSNEEFTYENYKPNQVNTSSGFENFFKVIASIVGVIFIGYFVIVVISVLNRKLKI
ncbi:MAG: hypothetical protein Q9M11_00010 [Mariprofundaceae bacterium]|nr:hypothetical protein [Mariprofundaceae bacterium]